MLRRFDRYVLKEILGPVTLGFLLYTFILVMQFLFRSAEMIIRRGVPAEQVGKLLLMTLPNIVVLTIPMSFLFGILVAVGRLAADSELVAMRSSGVSLFYLYRPILALSLVLGALNLWLMLDVLPRGNHALQQLRVDIITHSVARQVEPRVFYEEWEGVVLYVFAVDANTGEWQGVFVAEDLPSAENQVTVASRGGVRMDEENDRLVLRLENAYIHQMDFRQPQKYKITRFESLERVLVDRVANRQARTTTSKGLREMNLPELRARLADPDISSQLRNITWVEIHKKFAISAACIVFGLIALPLGFTSGRSSRSTGFAVSTAVIVVYYIMLNNGEEAARVGEMRPWLAMWLPNFSLTIVGAFFLVRRNSDKSLLLTQLDRWIRRQHFPGLQAMRERRRRRRLAKGEARRIAATRTDQGVAHQAGRAPAHLVLRLPQVRLRFPNRLDRYIMKMFWQIMVIVTISGVSIYIVADLSDRVDEILTNHPGTDVIVDYYKYLSLQIIYEISPMTVLVTTLFVFGLLSRSNEITAIKASGISLYRISVPVLVAALMVVALDGFLAVRLLPASNERVAQLKDTIQGRDRPRTYRRADRQWLFGQGRYIYNFLNYDHNQKAIHRLQVFDFDEHGALNRRLFSTSASFQGRDWEFNNGWVRTFSGLDVLGFDPFDRVHDSYPETPDYFESEYRLPDAMSFVELKDYIREVEGSGQKAPELQVELYKKVAFPFNALVMALVALPFSFRLGRQGALYGVGVGVVLGMVFFAMLAFTATLGEAGALPPLIAVTVPGISFTLLSLYLFLGVRT